MRAGGHGRAGGAHASHAVHGGRPPGPAVQGQVQVTVIGGGGREEMDVDLVGCCGGVGLEGGVGGWGG